MHTAMYEMLSCITSSPVLAPTPLTGTTTNLGTIPVQLLLHECCHGGRFGCLGVQRMQMAWEREDVHNS